MPSRTPPKRDAELSGKPSIEKKLLEVFKAVEKGFQDQRSRSDNIMDNWDLYNGKLGQKQVYNGNSQIFVPIIEDAVRARKTRFVGQLMPQSGRYVEVTTGEIDPPHATMSLLEGYVRKAKLRTKVLPAMLVNGDVEGQYSIYVDWSETSRFETRREKAADVTMGKGDEKVPLPELGEHDEYVGEEIKLGRPTVEVLHDADVLVLPVTADDIEEAIEDGGSVTVIRRWTKGKIKAMIKSGDIVKEIGDAIVKSMDGKARADGTRDTGKDMADAAGIKGAGAHLLVYETWTRLKVEGKERLCRAYFGGEQQIMGAKLCPYWCDKVPVISAPVEKVAGVFKGRSMIEGGVSDLQILANDIVNEGADTGHFSAMPIVMTDPEKNPRVGTMVLGLAAVWQTNPQSTEFATFPDMWKSMMDRVVGIKDQIFQSLSVNPSMIPQSSGGANKKRNQAEIAMEQNIDLLTTADAAATPEEEILTAMVQRFAEYDHQFRDEAITVQVYGQIGVHAQMERVEPIQLNEKWTFKWWGLEATREAARQQQQIAGLNVIKGIPPAMYPGYKLNVAPMIVSMVENLFGPRLAPRIFEKIELVSADPMIENEMLTHGFQVPVNPGDNDQEHMMVHMAGMQQTQDPHGTFRDHLMKHQQKMQAAAQQQQQQAQGAPGGPGGQGPGVSGTPPGAQPGQPHAAKGPPGTIHPDQMSKAGAVGNMPRKM